MSSHRRWPSLPRVLDLIEPDLRQPGDEHADHAAREPGFLISHRAVLAEIAGINAFSA